MKLDNYVGETIAYYFSDLRGVSTNEFYEKYLEFCEKDRVKPKAKSAVIRQAKWYCDVEIIEKRKVICEKYFVTKGYDGYEQV